MSLNDKTQIATVDLSNVNVDLMNRFLYFTKQESKGDSENITAKEKLTSFIFTKTMLKENTFLDSMEHEENHSIKSKIMTAILTNDYSRQKSLI